VIDVGSLMVLSCLSGGICFALGLDRDEEVIV
jgi:hypothetical protein